MGPEWLRVKDLARRSYCYTEDDFEAALKVLDRVYARRNHGIVIIRGGASTEFVPSSTRNAGNDSSGQTEQLDAPGDDIGSVTSMHQRIEGGSFVQGQG
jgi:hypothetical protein